MDMFKDLLSKKNMTCYSLAKKSGMSYTAINELYRGERDIGECSFKNALALASALNISLYELRDVCSCRSPVSASLAKYFWDAEISDLDLIKNMFYIIPRLLQHGGFEGFLFVWNNYTYEEIKLVATESRNLGAKVAYSLMNYFKLREEQMAYFTKRKGEWR